MIFLFLFFSFFYNSFVAFLLAPQGANRQNQQQQRLLQQVSIIKSIWNHQINPKPVAILESSVVFQRQLIGIVLYEL
jgi:hypothetical protein